ncbi:polyadenylate-binding protein-interacting protein 2 [Ischnura elegans]|uniref:polyadenylate-binding protein-interacting protein 2 n=1 Tax=Ischnura elegans TaxID=197161 RepID=UPI001ED877D4|nr:polyadenylate-binding protein-interacting protein 2 [Ischnura elegans]
MIMKIPGSGSGNGYYGHESVISYISDASELGNANDDLDSPTTDGDFSEYMWMENEEEFDKEVMQQLEEEALMEQCIEAMLEDEREMDGMQNGSGNTNGSSENCPRSVSQENGVQTNNSPSDICQNMENLRVHDDLARQSTLNPNAAEFVPQRRSATLIHGSKTT